MAIEGLLSTLDNKQLVTYSWKSKEPVAKLIFHHGLGEHVKRYDAIFTRFAEEGISVTGYDARGHGETLEKFGGIPGDCGDWSLVKKDIEAIIEQQKPSNLPIFLVRTFYERVDDLA